MQALDSERKAATRKIISYVQKPEEARELKRVCERIRRKGEREQRMMKLRFQNIHEERKYAEKGAWRQRETRMAIDNKSGSTAEDIAGCLRDDRHNRCPTDFLFFFTYSLLACGLFMRKWRA